MYPSLLCPLVTGTFVCGCWVPPCSSLLYSNTHISRSAKALPQHPRSDRLQPAGAKLDATLSCRQARRTCCAHLGASPEPRPGPERARMRGGFHSRLPGGPWSRSPGCLGGWGRQCLPSPQGQALRVPLQGEQGCEPASPPWWGAESFSGVSAQMLQARGHTWGPAGPHIEALAYPFSASVVTPPGPGCCPEGGRRGRKWTTARERPSRRFAGLGRQGFSFLRLPLKWA